MLFVSIGFNHSRVMNPLQFMVGLLTIVSLFVAFFHFKNNNVQVQNLLQNKPYINLIVITIFSGFILNAIGSVLVFLFSICLPLTRKNIKCDFKLLIYKALLFKKLFLYMLHWELEIWRIKLKIKLNQLALNAL